MTSGFRTPTGTGPRRCCRCISPRIFFWSQVIAVERDDDVQVDDGPALELGRPAIGELDRGRVDATLLGSSLEEAFDGDAGASPQFAVVVVPDHLGRVVVAVQAQRSAYGLVLVVVAGEAGHGAPVRPAGRVAAGVTRVGSAVAAAPIGAGVPLRDQGVRLTERWCGQRGEHGRMLRYGFRYAFAADLQGSDDPVCVALVHLGAVRADRGAPVAAGLVDHGVGHVLCGRVRQDAPGPCPEDQGVRRPLASNAGVRRWR